MNTRIERLPELCDSSGSRDDVARDLGFSNDDRSAPAGAVPFALHSILVGHGSSHRDVETEPLVVDDQEFYWLLPESSPQVWEEIGLPGQRLARPDPVIRAQIADALRVLAKRPFAMALVTKYISTFALVKRTTPDTARITSCSLPDYPLCIFFSERILEHIPPTTLGPVSPRLAAENIYHEAVHQAVSHLLLRGDLLPEDYDSASSPKLPIYWREFATEQRNREWELDRALHATTVYCHLLRWRVHELGEADLTEDERAAILAASVDSLGAVNSLVRGLMQHVEYFTPKGAMFLGRLAELAESRSLAVKQVIGEPS